MAKRVWLCKSCGGVDDHIEPWECPSCAEETCERCFWTYAHCKKCAEGKCDEVLRLQANNSGDWCFEPIKSS